MAATLPHPTDQILRAYGLGQLDDAPAGSVHSHLEACPDCRRRVGEVSSDSFLGRLRDAGVQPPAQGPIVSATDGLSLLAGGPVPTEPLPAGDLPPGLADHPDYEVLRELGRGGMGVVYLARNKLMDRLEVLKVVGAHLISKPAVLERFLREIRSAAQLHHPNIVTAYAATRLGESLVLAMEYVEGVDLARRVKEKGPLPIVHACYFVHQAALGLQHAHERGMVHRDIKPANLILAVEKKKAVVKVLDFGLAKVSSEGDGERDRGLTREGQMLGTPDYIAPEQIRNAQRADIRADIYSLGCTLYYLLTGGPPFGGDNLWDLYQAHFSMDASPLNLVRPEVPVELAALVAKMMAKGPEQRFQEPKEVAQALAPFFRPATAQLAAPVGDTRFRPDVGLTPKQSDDTTANPARNIGPPPIPPPARRSDSPTGGAKGGNSIGLEEAEPVIAAPEPKSVEPKPAPTKRPFRSPPWQWLSVAVGVLFLVLVTGWLGRVLKVTTPQGVIVVLNVPEDSEIRVDGEKVAFTWPGHGKPLEIRAVPGQHRVEANAVGFETQREWVTVKKGESTAMTVSLEPIHAEPPAMDVVNAEQDSSVLNGEAWELATAADATERDGAKAVELAKRACKQDGFKSSEFLDTLAAAHAEAGNFDEAVKWQTLAIEKLATLEEHAEYRGRLELYRLRKPYHQGDPLADESANQPPAADATGASDGNDAEVVGEGTQADDTRPGSVQVSDEEKGAQAPQPPEQHYKPLFNGRDLAEWTAFSNSKKVDHSALARVSRGEIILLPTGEDSGLRTNRNYHNFILKLEYFFPVNPTPTKPGSGVIILPESRGGLSYQQGIQCQIRPGESGNLRTLPGATLVGEERQGQLGKIARKRDAEKPPGEWNEVVIQCEGSRIIYKLNGREVNRAEGPRLISGWIGLMNQGSEIHFRNIEVCELPPSPKGPAESSANANRTKSKSGEAGKRVTGQRVAAKRSAKANWSPSVVGRWRHDRVSPDPTSGTVTLAQNGSILNARGTPCGTWRMQPGSLILLLRWPNKQAPGGAWIDQVVLSVDWKRYDGRNQRGAIIHGQKLE